MVATVLLNARAGSVNGSGDDPAQRISEAFAKAGVSPEICYVEPEKIVEAARAAACHSDIVVAAGGDGTLQGVAQGMLGGEAAFAVLPVGTFNHLAKELEMPLDVEAAAEAIARGGRQALPVALVNGRPFLSFAAVGLYARAVRHREAQRRALQRSRFHGMAVALLRTIRRPTYRRLRLEIEGRILRRYTSSLFVVSNEYQLQALGLLEPHRLDRSQLNICVANTSTPWQVFRLIIAGVMGRLQRVMEVLVAPALTVHTRHRQETVILDGEVVSMEVPLKFTMSATPLTVIVPPEELRHKPTAVFIKRA